MAQHFTKGIQQWIVVTLLLFVSSVVGDRDFGTIAGIPIAAIFGIFIALIILVLCCRFLCRQNRQPGRMFRQYEAPVTVVTQTGQPSSILHPPPQHSPYPQNYWSVPPNAPMYPPTSTTPYPPSVPYPPSSAPSSMPTPHQNYSSTTTGSRPAYPYPQTETSTTSSGQLPYPSAPITSTQHADYPPYPPTQPPIPSAPMADNGVNAQPPAYSSLFPERVGTTTTTTTTNTTTNRFGQ